MHLSIKIHSSNGDGDCESDGDGECDSDGDGETTGCWTVGDNQRA